MDKWKQEFLDKLNRAQRQWSKAFGEAVERHFEPVFEAFEEFLVPNGFRLSKPLQEPERRSFKFELAENAYLLVLLRLTGVGEFEWRSECFAPGCQPVSSQMVVRVSELDRAWCEQRLQAALDAFVDLLAGEEAVASGAAEAVPA